MFIYDINDVKNKLEEMTEDEDEVMQKSPRTQEIYKIKKINRVAFKRDEAPPATNLEFYKVGRLLGRGAFGKVNLAL